MKIELEIPEYNRSRGFVFDWEEDFKIEVKVSQDSVIITANKEGLLSLARHLVNLSQDHFLPGYNIHLDAYNSLEEGSNELIIQKQ